MTRNGSNLMVAAALVIVLAAIRSSTELVLPFLLAVLISIIAAVPVAWLRGKGMPTSVAVTIVAAALVLLLFGATMVLATSVRGFSDTLPAYLDDLQASTEKLTQWLTDKGIVMPGEGVSDVLNPGAAMRLANSLLGSLTQLLSNIFLIVMTVILMLLEASTFSTKIGCMGLDSGKTLSSITRFLDTTKRYMAIKAATSLATGIFIAVGMALLGVKYPVLWGFLALLLNFIPNIGSILAAVPAVLLAWLQLGYRSALAAAACFLVVNMVIGNVIEPRVMGRGMGLSTLVVFVSLVFWGWLLGPVGMLLSVPLTMLVKFWAEANEDTRWIAVLLSSSPRA